MSRIYFLIFVVTAVLLYWAVNPSYTEEIETVVELPIVDSTITVSFSSVGDIMCHSTQYNYAWIQKDSFDFKPVFRYLKNYLSNKDILFGNLETVLAGRTNRFSGYPFFNSPNQLAEALKFAGFDFLFTANNHANDQGYNGVKRTIAELKRVNIVNIGTSDTSLTENYNIFVRKGLRFGVLAYTYGTNYKEGSPKPYAYVNYIDTLKIRSDISELKRKNTDVIIVYFHIGEQYSKSVTKYQRKIVQSTINAGADIILASHPHIIQPFERFETKGANLDSGFVTYSLGNFLSNQRWRYSDGGLIFNFDITKNIFTDSVYISNLSYLPIWVFKGNTNLGKEYLLLPSENYMDSTLNFMTEADIDSMKRSYYDTVELFTSKSNYPKTDRLKINN